MKITKFGLFVILRLIATIPLFIIFLISSWYLISQYNINTNLKDLKYKFSIALDLVNLSKELDKEMIIMDPISKELNRKITDRTIEHIKRLHHNKMNLSGVPADERSMHNPRIPSHSNLFFPALLCELAAYNESNSIRHSLSANLENTHKIDAYYEDFFP